MPHIQRLIESGEIYGPNVTDLPNAYYDAINEYNDKVTLFKRLQTISYERFRGEHVQMDSFIISKTDFQVLRRREGMERQEFAEKWHILFRDPANPTYLDPIFQEQDLPPV